MVDKQLKMELMDAVQSAISQYFRTTRGANFAGAGVTVKRPRVGSVLVTGLRNREGLEFILEEVRS
jgi:hypothetical protein